MLQLQPQDIHPGGCTAKSEEVERLLDKVRRRGATLEEEALLEFFKQAGLLEC